MNIFDDINERLALLQKENKILNNILKRIKDSCENIKQVDDRIRIKLIEEILEDKYDIHYFLEREENGTNN